MGAPGRKPKDDAVRRNKPDPFMFLDPDPGVEIPRMPLGLGLRDWPLWGAAWRDPAAARWQISDHGQLVRWVRIQRMIIDGCSAGDLVRLSAEARLLEKALGLGVEGRRAQHWRVREDKPPTVGRPERDVEGAPASGGSEPAKAEGGSTVVDFTSRARSVMGGGS